MLQDNTFYPFRDSYLKQIHRYILLSDIFYVFPNTVQEFVKGISKIKLHAHLIPETSKTEISNSKRNR